MPRKKPYSGKQKKLQLQNKRNKKGSSDHIEGGSQWQNIHNTSEDSAEDQALQQITSDIISQQKVHKEKGEFDPNRYRLNFLSESKEEIERRKHEAQTVAITFVPQDELEVDIKDVYQPGSELDMPKRPKWSYKMSKDQLEKREENYFQEYLTNIYKTFGDKNLSYFEHNLETWRQLWRVLEMSDVIVMVTDVRHPVLHFSPALYDYVIKELSKPLILVLNKIDLAPASVVAAWTSYFKEMFPHLHIVWFTSFPHDVRTVHTTQQKKARRSGKRVYNTQIGPEELLRVCQSVCGDKVDLSTWQQKIESDLEKLGFYSNDASHGHQPSSGDGVDVVPAKVAGGHEPPGGDGDERYSSRHVKKEQFEDGILTIGFVGHPNVGKSSLMNGLIGKKKVSTSVTPGHTKYFQTYFLTRSVKLCDSPGLVFPSLIHKQLQILSGIYPVAQVREPYTPVGYLSARLQVVKILQLKHPSDDASEKWTPWDICEAWATQRRYMTAKAARPDVYRAANSILRMAVDGRLCMYMRPPGYSTKMEYWEQHENTIGLLALRATGHFHGNIACDVEGKPFHIDDFIGDSSDSVADSNSGVSGVSDYSDVEDDDDEEMDDTLVEDMNAATNKFALLACDSD